MSNEAGVGRAFSLVYVGIPLAVLLEAAAQLLAPGRSPLAESESVLALGPYGFVETLSIALRAGLTLVFLEGLRRAVAVPPARASAGAVLLALSAVLKFAVAFIPTDLTPRPTTLHGVVHAISAFAAFLAGAVAELLIAIALHRGHVRPRGAGALMALAASALAWSLVVIATAPLAPRFGLWGLFERVYTGLFLAWLVLAARVLDRTRAGSQAMTGAEG